MGYTNLSPMSSDTETPTKNNIQRLGEYGCSYDETSTIAEDRIVGDSFQVDYSNSTAIMTGAESLILVDTTDTTPGNRTVKIPPAGTNINVNKRCRLIRETSGNTITLDCNDAQINWDTANKTCGTNKGDGFLLIYVGADNWQVSAITAA